MKPPAFQFYAADFLVGTATMAAEEVGAYIRLLCYQWDTGSVPDDDATIARLGGCQASAVAKVRQKFRKDEDGLRNERMEKERAKQRAFREKQAENGAKRWAGNAKPQALAKPSDEPNACSPSPSSSPSNTNTPLPPKGGELPLLASPDDKTDESPVPPDYKPKTKGPLQLRAERLMKRRESTPLTQGESRALSKNRAAIEATTEEDWQALERFYAAPQAQTYARKDLAALLNNWNGEIDRAKAWVEPPPIGTPVEPIKPRIPDNLRDDIDT